MKIAKLSAIVAVGMIACLSLAQGGGGRGGQFGAQTPTSLVNRDDVKEDLKLTDDQKTKLDAINTELNEKRRAVFTDSNGDRDAMVKGMTKLGEDTAKKVNEVLTADQQTRLKEIFIQFQGNRAVTNKDVAKDIALTDDQKKSVDDLVKKQGDAQRSVFEKVQAGEIDRSEVRAIMDKNNKALDDEIGKVLTSDQKDKLKTMGGKPFVRKDPPGRGGGGGGL